MEDRRILTNWYKEIARHCLQDRKTKRPITNRRHKMKVDVTIMGRKTTAEKTKLRKIENVKDAYYCPVAGCDRVMFGIDGVYRCKIHNNFVPLKKS